MNTENKVGGLPEETVCLRLIDPSEFKQGPCEDEEVLSRVRKAFRSADHHENSAGVEFGSPRSGSGNFAVYDLTGNYSYSGMIDSLSSDPEELICGKEVTHFLANNLERLRGTVHFLLDLDSVASVSLGSDNSLRVEVHYLDCDNLWLGFYGRSFIVPQS